MLAAQANEETPASAGEVQVQVKVFDQDTRIAVLVARHGWAHTFTIRLKDGELPPQYASDPEIVAAYKQVRYARERWQRKQLPPVRGGTAPGSPQGREKREETLAGDRPEIVRHG